MPNSFLPKPPAAIGAYRSGVLRQGIGMVSGQFPLVNGDVRIAGRLGTDLTLEQGREAAAVAAMNVLAQIDSLLGGFDRLVGLLRVDGIVASDAAFLAHASVLDAASDTFNQYLGEEKGAHARSLIPVARLPMDAPVQIVVTFSYQPDPSRIG